MLPFGAELEHEELAFLPRAHADALILQTAAEGLVPMPLASLIHERLTAMVAKGRDDRDWAGFAREVSESAGL